MQEFEAEILITTFNCWFLHSFAYVLVEFKIVFDDLTFIHFYHDVRCGFVSKK